MRLLADLPGFQAGEFVWTTPTEAGMAVEQGMAELAPVPLVRRSATEQLNTAWAIHGRTRNV